MQVELLPADWLVIIYLIFINVLLVGFRSNLVRWHFYIIVHLVLIITILVSRLISEPLPLPLQVIRDWYPVALMFTLYWQVGSFTQLIVQGYYDDVIIRLEGHIFKGQPSMSLSSRFPFKVLSEFLHLCYLLYYGLLMSLVLPLYLQGRLEEFYEVVFVDLLITLISFVWFIFVPVAGPRYKFEKIGGPLATGFFYKLTHSLLSRASSKGTALPSLHVSQSLVVLFFAWRYGLPYFSIVLLICAGILACTVYGRFHYAIDVVAGVIVACTGFAVGPLIFSFLETGL